MKSFFALVGLASLTLGVPSGLQQTELTESCQFTLSRSTKPVITGPDELTQLVHVLEQPDSPVEILAVDFKDSFLSVADGQVFQQLRCTMRVRNRSNQTVKGFQGLVQVATRSSGGGSGFQRDGLAPGAEMEFRACLTNGRGGAPDDHVEILVYVEQVEMSDYFYKPSRRIPYELGVHPF